MATTPPSEQLADRPCDLQSVARGSIRTDDRDSLACLVCTDVGRPGSRARPIMDSSNRSADDQRWILVADRSVAI